ncbi:hypothetical protein SO802_026684 [Lithocarpus litseifolius]|uniref:Uncharacterized protein n=1 Tax=Lithocarpus litseifolius TaxID=425828 RepID=A0AAW2C3Z2_9ROSI
MPPKRKVTVACKAMKSIGFPESEVKPVLNRLLELSDYNWGYIENDEYRALIEALLQKKQEQEKSVEFRKKEACSNEKAKGSESEDFEPIGKRLRRRHQEERALVAVDCSEPEDSEPLVKRLHQRHQEERALVAVDCSEPEDSEPLVKRLHQRHQEESALVPVKASNSQLVITPSKRGYQDINEVSLGSQDWSEPEDSEPLLKRSRPRRARQSRPDAKLVQICDEEEVDESTQLKVWIEQSKSKPVSLLQHPKNESRKCNSSTTSPVPKAKGPSQPNLCNNSAESYSLSFQEKGKTSVTPQVAPGERRLTSERGNGIRPIEKLMVEPYLDHTPVENVLDMYQENNFNLPRDEPSTDNHLLDEVPLAVILPDIECSSSYGNGSNAKADVLEVLESKSLDMNEKAPSVYGLSNGKSPAAKEDGSKSLDSESLDVMDKGDGVSEVSQFDITSSSKREVKLSLICNSSERSDFHIPSLDAVFKVVEENFLKLHGLTEFNFSLLELMTEFCERFWAMGTDSAVVEHLRSTNIPASKISDAQGGHDGNDGHVGNHCIPSSLSSGSVRFQNPIKVIPQIPKPIAPSGLGGLHCVAGFEIKDMENICGESERRLKLLKDPQSSNSNNREIVQKHQSPFSIVNYCDYVDDITRGEEKVKIPLMKGSAEDLPAFRYISKSLVYRKGYVNFALARISDEHCCSNCFGDCLSSPVPCACARETKGEFAYMPGGLLKQNFLEESITINRNPKKHQYFYCKNCPLEGSKNKKKSNRCKGHLLRRFIKECWSKCGCNKSCGNRVVQRGITAKLQVFWTPEGKGWGLRTLQDLPRAAFVCEYVGEIVTNSELHERNLQNSGTEKHTYPVLLDADWVSEGVLKDEEALCLDATVYGNVARFINHRCHDATLVEIPVEVETPDHHYYHLAFFTTRKVDAMEELTWDYGIDFNDCDHPVKAFQCLCGSQHCRGSNR